jgi:hypothetical protein
MSYRLTLLSYDDVSADEATLTKLKLLTRGVVRGSARAAAIFSAIPSRRSPLLLLFQLSQDKCLRRLPPRRCGALAPCPWASPARPAAPAPAATAARASSWAACATRWRWRPRTRPARCVRPRARSELACLAPGRLVTRTALTPRPRACCCPARRLRPGLAAGPPGRAAARAGRAEAPVAGGSQLRHRVRRRPGGAGQRRCAVARDDRRAARGQPAGGGGGRRPDLRGGASSSAWVLSACRV